MTLSLLASPTTLYCNHHHPLTSERLHLGSSSSASLSSLSLLRYTSSKAKLLTVSLCSTSSSSSSSSTPLVEEQNDDDVVIPDPIPPQPIIEDVFQVSPGGCKACGRDEMERGCNGEGRIQGGIATVPGFGWWPIKAYRPCPGFLASGGLYRRSGQSMDEVAFGRGGRATSAGSNGDAAELSKKGRDPRRFKR